MTQNETINDALARAETAEYERDQLRVALKEAVSRAEVAERERDAAVESRALAESDGAKALGFLQELGRYFGRPRETGETIDAWWKRLVVTIHEHLPSLYDEPKPCANPHCVPYDAHAKLMGEKEQLRRERDDAIQRHRIAEETVVEYRTKLDALAAAFKGAISAIVRA